MLMKFKSTVLFRYLKELYFRFKDDDLSALSAHITYFLILSFFPFLIFLINLLSFTSLSGQISITDINRFIPKDISIIMKSVADRTMQSSNKTLLSFGMLGSLWAASKGISAVIRGLNKAYDVKETRKFLVLNLVAIVSTIGIIVMITLSLIMIVFGRILGEYVFGLIGAENIFELLWAILRYLIPAAIMFLTFLLLYKFAPNKRLKVVNIRLGAAFATLGWLLTSLVFSYYVDNFGHYEKVYGSLGGMMVLIIWLNVSTLIILLGGEINAVSYHFQQKDQEREKRRKGENGEKEREKQ